MSSLQPAGGMPASDSGPPPEIFPPTVRAAFQAVIEAEGYTNRERFSYKKWVRLQVFLDKPDLTPVDQKDRKIKFEALHEYELYNDSSGRKLYRLPDKGHLERRLVVSAHDAFDVLTSIHLKLGHPGRNKCFYGVDQQYYGLKREECYWIKEHCRTCILNAITKNKAPMTAIVSKDTFERVQIDLIDMRHTPSGRYAWILHIKDHFSKYSQLYALKSKHALGIAECLALWIMAFYPMKILQCDNGKEFKGRP